MHASTLITAIFLAALSVSAGPHDNIPRRRHHARRAVVPAQLVDKIKRESNLVAQSRTSCTNGDWQCVGSELQRCNFDTWISIQNCTGENVVCSADSKATGCVWTWSVDDANDTPVTVSPIPTLSFSSSSAGPSPTKNTGSVANANGDDDNEESSSPIQQSSSTAAPSPSPSLIGGVLYAGDNGDDSQSSSSRRGKKHKTSSGPDWYGASSSLVDWAASSTDDWSQFSTTDSPSSTQDWYDAGGYATASSSASKDWSAQSASDSGIPSTSKHRGKTSGTATSSSAISQPTGGGDPPSGDYNAPHYVIYADQWLQRMPDAGDLSAYNRFILAFWMTTGGAVDNAQAWEQFDADYRQQVLDSYHAAGIALMVSAFGSTDSPTTNGVDPTDCAQQLASWVKQYGLDGVDIDYEDMNAMNNDQAEAWLITFQNELRRQLPAPYLISHAPVAPWFTSGNNYPSGAYVSVWKQTGHGIDFFNVQFYNQGNNVYEDCDSLLTDSGSSWPDTSVFGINSYAGVPLNKIVIGKPIDAGAASNGYMDGSTLAQCVAQAQNQGWNGGVMFWEWSALIGNSFMAEVRG